VSAVDVRGIGTPLPAGGQATAGFTFGGDTTVPGAGSDAPGTYADRAFTIAAGEANRSATITVSWDNSSFDWDLIVLRRDGDALTEVGSSAEGPPSSSEQVVLSRPATGSYVIRVRNFAAGGTFAGRATFAAAAPGDSVAGGSAAYVGFCGYCDALNTAPFGNGLATNVRPDGTIGRPGASENWHIAGRAGLPNRYITSVQMDPSDARTVYVTLAGYSRRWLKPGSIGGAAEGSDVGGGHVFRSTDAGDTFTDISGNLPDIPANFSLVRNGQLIVGTDLGVFIGSGGTYAPLGTALPAVPVLSLELKPKAVASEPDTLIVATQGRGVYRYVFGSPGPVGPLAPAAKPAPGSSTKPPLACAASRALRTATARGHGGGLRIGFTRTVARPVAIDVFRVSQGRRVLTERLVKRYKARTKGFTWNGRGSKPIGDGYYVVRFKLREASGLTDVRRLVLQRSHGRWHARPAYYGRLGCATVRSFKLLRPVFGGSGRRALGISVVLTRPASVAVTVRRGRRVVKRYSRRSVAANRTYRQSLASKGLARGDYRVTIEVRQGSERVVNTLTSRRL
jgi:hypothetical protein